MSQDHKCAGRVPGNFKQKKWDPLAFMVSGHTEVRRPRLCAKRATRFVDVSFSELKYHMKREAKFDDVIPLCEECWARLGPGVPASLNATFVSFFPDGTKASQYFGQAVQGLRGTVGKAVLLDEPPPVGAVLTKEMKELLGIKANLKRIMSQKNVAFCTPDQWRRVFEDALDEHVVGEVLDS